MTDGAAVGPVDPTAATVVGHPVAHAQYWLCRGRAAACAPPVVAVVLAEILGVPLHSNAEVKVRALALDLIGFDLHPGRVPGVAGDGPVQGWTGMAAADVAALCGSYGVEVEVARSSVAELAARLAAGDAVVVSLDTDRLRVGGLDGTLPGLGLDTSHALVLTGVDHAAGLVYLNCPAEPSGTGVAIPLDQFADAWAHAGNAVLEISLPEHDAAGLHTWGASARAADPWTELGDPVLVADVGGGAASALGRRRLHWLPFSFAATAAAPAG